MISRKIEVESMDELVQLFGPFDENIKAICQAFDVKVVMQDGQSLLGEDENVTKAIDVLNKLKKLLYDGQAIDIGRVNYFCDCAKISEAVFYAGIIFPYNSCRTDLHYNFPKNAPDNYINGFPI